jgi:hypothetical protein
LSSYFSFSQTSTAQLPFMLLPDCLAPSDNRPYHCPWWWWPPPGL